MSIPFSELIRFNSNGLLTEKRDPPARITFHHIPKTAGTSFDTFLKGFVPEHVRCPNMTDDIGDMDGCKYLYYSGHFYFHTLENKLSDTLWAVILRHPVKRILSQYQNWHDPDRILPYWQEIADRHPPVKEALELAQTLPLSDWIRSENEVIKDALRNAQTRLLTSIDPGEATYHPDAIVDAKKNLFERFHFFGLTEYFNDSVLMCCAQFGLRPQYGSAWHKENVTPVKDRVKPDRATLRLIGDMNQMDIELYEAAEVEFKRRFTLLSTRYAEECWRVKHQTVSDASSIPISLPLDHTLSGAGWSFPEVKPDGMPFRWVSSSTATIDFSLPVDSPRSFKVRIGFFSSVLKDRYKGIKLSLDGMPPIPAKISKQPHKTAIAEATMVIDPDTPVGGMHTIGIHAPAVHLQVVTNDRPLGRVLAVAADSFEILPA